MRRKAHRSPESESNFQSWLGVMLALAVVLVGLYGSEGGGDSGWRFDLFSIVSN